MEFKMDATSVKTISVGHVRYINVLTWLQGFRVKIANFLSFFCLSIPKRDLNTEKATPNREVCTESLGAILEYSCIESGLLEIIVLLIPVNLLAVALTYLYGI